jgi:CC2D2A N-terminal C2 domain
LPPPLLLFNPSPFPASERLRISRDRIARRTNDLPSSPTPNSRNTPNANSPRAPGVDGGDGDATATAATAAGTALTKRFDDAGDAIVDMGWGEAGAWPLAEKVWGASAAAVPDLVTTSTPLSVFNAWDALMPDGHGETLAQYVVREPLALDAWGNIPANAALLAAATAVSSATSATNQGKSSSSAWQEAAEIFAHRTEINALPPSAAHPASLAVAAWAATTGGYYPSSTVNGSINSGALRSALREALTSFDANATINFSTPMTAVLDENADAAALVKAIADIQPHSVGLGLASARPSHICVGTSAVTPGAESRDRGALDAGPWSMLVDLRRDARALIAAANHKDGPPPSDATTSSITAATSVLAVPLPLLHVSRAIVLDTATERDEGMGGDAASTKETGAQLRVRVGGIAFRDHPLFSREDWAASALRGAFQEYSRRMIVGGAALARVDARLAALLANAFRSGEGGGGGGGTGYDFDGDSLSDLAARAAAVLELLSIRHDEVTSAADVMRRVAVRAESLNDARVAAGYTVTPLRLEAREVPLENAGMVASQPRLYAILVAAGALFEVLASRAASAGTGGRASSAARSTSGGGATDSENDAINETRRLRFAINEEVPSSLIATADRLVTEFRAFQIRIRGGEEEHGRGYACGGVGSGVSDDAAIVALCTRGEAALTSSSRYDERDNTGTNFPGAREFLLFLRADVECAATVPIDKVLRNALPPAEIRRRATIARTQVIVKIAVNGRDVAESLPTYITLPGFTVTANLDVSLRLRRRPTTLSVRIVEANSIARWFGGAPMAEVLVPVPGAADDAGSKVWGVGRGGAGNKFKAHPRAAAAAVVPVSGFFGFSASLPLHYNKVMMIQTLYRGGRRQLLLHC